jgi:hypothetical protein
LLKSWPLGVRWGLNRGNCFYIWASPDRNQPSGNFWAFWDFYHFRWCLKCGIQNWKRHSNICTITRDTAFWKWHVFKILDILTSWIFIASLLTSHVCFFHGATYPACSDVRHPIWHCHCVRGFLIIYHVFSFNNIYMYIIVRPCDVK